MFSWIFIAILTVSSLFSLDRSIKFCLLMFTENQNSMIADCLKSVEGLVDAVCVIDMGCLDWTNMIVEAFIEQNKLPGGVFFYEGKGIAPEMFGIKMGRKILEGAGFSLEDTYFLLLDGDMILEMSPKFKKDSLDLDSYLILQKNPSLSYSSYDVRLIRASLLWQYNPLIHDCWNYDEAQPPAKLQNLIIERGAEDLDQKLEKIKNVLIKDPENGEYLFSLAQYYKAQKEYEKALPIYMELIAKKGNFEQFWLSHYMIGACYDAMKRWDKALNWYLEAFHVSPNRTEPLHKISYHYRCRGQNHLAYLFAKHGSRITRSSDQKLFDSPPLLGYEFDEEISISAYYTPFKQDGFHSASNLLIRKYVPDWIWAQNGRNMFFYDVFLKKGEFQSIHLDLPAIDSRFQEKYHPMVSSIVKTEQGYKLVCSAVNYTQTGAKIFQTTDPDGVFRTKIFFLHLDQNFNVLSQKAVIEKLPRERFPACNLAGLQDSRLFEWEGADWLCCTTTDTNPTGNRQVSLCKLSEDRSLASIEVEQLIPLKGPNIYRQEKNWLPFIYKDHLEMIHSYAPFTLYTPSFENGESIVKIAQESSLDFSHFRGSAAPIPFDDGYLMLVHEVIPYPDYTRSYLHRFLFLNTNLEIEKISDSFAFLHEGIERCNSMTIDHSGKQLVLPIGIEDREIYFCSIPIENIRSLLHPLPDIEGDFF